MKDLTKIEEEEPEEKEEQQLALANVEEEKVVEEAPPKKPPRVRPSRAKPKPETPPINMETIKRELMEKIKEDLMSELSTKRTHQVMREEKPSEEGENQKSGVKYFIRYNI